MVKFPGGKVSGKGRTLLAVFEGLDGVRIGHATDRAGVTGCTVLLCPQGCRAGVDVRGSAPGTRETDVLRPGNLVGMVHAVLLTGGSAFGLAAAEGVARYLEAREAGFPTPAGPVPIVAAAVLYDLDLGDARARPDEAMGWAACQAAEGDGPPEEGSVGAGTGATVGKLYGREHRMKGGLGVAQVRLSGGYRMAAVAAVNAVGDVYDPADGRWLAGAWNRRTRRPLAPAGHGLAEVGAGGGVGAGDGAGAGGGVGARVEAEADGRVEGPAQPPLGPGQATTLACVVTDLPLEVADLTKVAQMAHDGLARAVRPPHTLWDGDTIFALSTGRGKLYGGRARPLAVSEAGVAAAEALAGAIVRAVRLAESLAGVPAYRDVQGAGRG